MGLLQITELAFVLLFDLQWLAAQGIFHAALAFIDSLLNLRRVEVVGPAGLGDRGLALNDVQEQGRLSLGRPTLDVVFHQGAHLCFLSR